LEQVGRLHAATPAQVALAWLMTRPAVTAPIIGANSVEQLHGLLGVLDVQLTADDLETLNDASAWQQA
jgi:aryl-alcohol dehydrogenase-like predicted oxidoreductase